MSRPASTSTATARPTSTRRRSRSWATRSAGSTACGFSRDARAARQRLLGHRRRRCSRPAPLARGAPARRRAARGAHAVAAQQRLRPDDHRRRRRRRRPNFDENLPLRGRAGGQHGARRDRHPALARRRAGSDATRRRGVRAARRGAAAASLRARRHRHQNPGTSEVVRAGGLAARTVQFRHDRSSRRCRRRRRRRAQSSRRTGGSARSARRRPADVLDTQGQSAEHGVGRHRARADDQPAVLGGADRVAARDPRLHTLNPAIRVSMSEGSWL